MSHTTTTITIDKAGRMVIPKNLREELRIEAGDRLELKSDGENINLRPIRSSTALRKEHGVWVFRTGRRIPNAMTEQVLRETRERRDRHNRETAR